MSEFSKKVTNDNKININVSLVQGLICDQFPQWSKLPIQSIKPGGWDNRMFRLGENMAVRLPSGAEYVLQVEKEQYWLPILQPHLPLAIPNPIAMGNPTAEYPWHWSIYQWLGGETARLAPINDLNLFAKSLANFLKALQHCDTKGAPAAGPDNFHRGGRLSVYDSATREAIAKIADKKLAYTLLAIWEKALVSVWQNAPVWIHGDIAVGNLLVSDEKLTAVIDFGQLAVGDPACDLVIYWTFLTGQSREIFRQVLALDKATWDRARGWVLWKTLCAPIAGTDCNKILHEIVAEFKHEGKE